MYMRPCPKCGKELEATDDPFRVACQEANCRYSGPKAATMAEAIDSWNRLPRDQPELQPCPICKSDAVFSKHDPHDYCAYYVECNKCGYRSERVSRYSQSIQQWNQLPRFTPFHATDKEGFMRDTPCIHCGKPVHVVGKGYGSLWHVECESCGTAGPYKANMDEATKAYESLRSKPCEAKQEVDKPDSVPCDMCPSGMCSAHQPARHPTPISRKYLLRVMAVRIERIERDAKTLASMIKTLRKDGASSDR